MTKFQIVYEYIFNFMLQLYFDDNFFCLIFQQINNFIWRVEELYPRHLFIYDSNV
jgi:hypothetical protein